MRMILTSLIFGLALQLGCAHTNTASSSAPPATAPATATAAPGAATAALNGKTPPAAKSAAADAENREVCTRGGDSRLIKLESVEPKGCRLLYPNAGNQIAASTVGNTHCVEVREKIRKNLEKVGFKCSAESAKAPAAAAVPPAKPAK
jgi:hypothetical protein